MDRDTKIPNVGNPNDNGKDKTVEEKPASFTTFKNKRNYPFNISLGGINYHADVGAEIKIPTEHVRNKYFQEIKHDLAEVVPVKKEK